MIRVCSLLRGRGTKTIAITHGELFSNNNNDSGNNTIIIAVSYLAHTLRHFLEMNSLNIVNNPIRYRIISPFYR